MTEINNPEISADNRDEERWRAQLRALACLVVARIPVVLWGAPGAAKTSLVEGLLSSVCCDHYTSIVALHEPPEYGGYPMPVPAAQPDPGVKALPGHEIEPEPAHVAQLPVGWVLRLARAAERDPSRPAGLFLDELSNGAPASRSAAMRGILDGVWGDVKIPRLAVVAASNPDELSESGYRFSAALANRFCHIEWQLPGSIWTDAFLDGFTTGFPAELVPSVSPADVDRVENETVRPIIAAFARCRPDLFEGAPPEDESAQSRAWPSPRTWTMASRSLAVALAAGESPQGAACRLIVKGLVGQGAMTALLDYWGNFELPDPETVLQTAGKNPSSLVWPPRGDQVFAVLVSVSAAVRRDLTRERWVLAWKVFGAAARAGKAAFAASAANGLSKAGVQKWKKEVPVPEEIDLFWGMMAASGMVQS